MDTNTIDEQGKSFVETTGDKARTEQLSGNKYKNGENNNNAIEYGPEQGLMENGGRGVGNNTSTTFIRPNIDLSKDDMGGRANPTTDDGGNDCDHRAREVMTKRSLYGPDNVYCPNRWNSQGANGINIDTSKNEGQYHIDQAFGSVKWNCLF